MVAYQHLPLSLLLLSACLPLFTTGGDTNVEDGKESAKEEEPGTVAQKKKRKKSTRNYENIPKSEKEMFGSKSLRCLVCKAVVEEMDAAIALVPANKKVETGSFRLRANGEPQRRLVPYARSEGHLNDLLEDICKEFEEYAQARERATGEATIIRFLSKSGGMSPRFGEVDIVPDEDLNTRLKFYCEGIVEEQEDDLLELFAKPRKGIVKDLCHKRTNICPHKSVEKDEL